MGVLYPLSGRASTPITTSLGAGTPIVAALGVKGPGFPNSRCSFTDHRHRPLPTPSLARPSLSDVPNNIRLRVHRPGEQPGVLDRCRVRVGRTGEERCGYSSLHDLSQLLRQRRDVPWSASWSGRRRSGTTGRHWYRKEKYLLVQ